MAAGNGAQRSDRISPRFGPVASLRCAPGCHSQNAVVPEGSEAIRCAKSIHLFRHVSNDKIVDNLGNVSIPTRVRIHLLFQHITVFVGKLPELIEHLKKHSFCFSGVFVKWY